MKNTIGLVGNPNSGKTTLFNALTGSKQRVGNWPGVTVERKVGSFSQQGINIEVVDLPGTYNLVMVSDTQSVDERIACDFILAKEAELIVNVIDASNLERNLYLTLQLIEMRVPVILALNMIDIVKQRGIEIDTQALSKCLGCPVIVLESHKNKGISQLKELIVNTLQRESQCPQIPFEFPAAIIQAQTSLASLIHKENVLDNSEWLALRLLEDDYYAKTKVSESIIVELTNQQTLISTELKNDSDIVIADVRYSFVNQLTKRACKKSGTVKRNLTKIIDRIVLNRIVGIPIFLLIMYSMFFFAINIGGAFQNFFDIASDTIFVQGLSRLLMNIGLPTWITALFASGLGKGINTTVTFIPIIGGMFLFLSFLEDSGYMARAGFVMDRFMRAIGLPGKSFVPLIVGFGCNVPAIMSARTLENKRDRILTVMMSPFMSCGARLAIFAVFTAAFFPRGGQNIIFALYLIGIAIAILTGFILQKTLLRGEPSPMVMELPPYHIPRFKVVFRQTWYRLKNFLWKAGKLIVPICILIGSMNAINLNGTLNIHDANQQSLLSLLGQWLTPLFIPIGIHADNWPATVGLLTGVLAKEVVIATLNTLYTQVGHLALASSDFNFWANLQSALMTIPQNLQNLGSAFANPILASAPDHSVTEGVLGVMYQRFNGQASAFAYLLFVLLYIPCVSSAAAMARELGRYWATFSIFWNTSLAYGIAVIFYQLATIQQHVAESMTWVISILIFYVLIFVGLKIFASEKRLTGLRVNGLTGNY